MCNQPHHGDEEGLPAPSPVGQYLTDDVIAGHTVDRRQERREDAAIGRRDVSLEVQRRPGRSSTLVQSRTDTSRN